MSDTKADDYLVLGKITSVFGVKGWVKVYSYTDPLENIFSYGQWVLRHQGRDWSVELLQGKRHGKGLIAQLKGYATPEVSRQLSGALIGVPRQNLPPLPEGEFYWSQLIGLEVWNLQNQYLGRVNYLMETGANDVLVVKPVKGSIDREERLLPWLMPEVIRQVDLERQRIDVDWDADF